MRHSDWLWLYSEAFRLVVATPRDILIGYICGQHSFLDLDQKCRRRQQVLYKTADWNMPGSASEYENNGWVKCLDGLRWDIYVIKLFLKFLSILPFLHIVFLGASEHDPEPLPSGFECWFRTFADTGQHWNWLCEPGLTNGCVQEKKRQFFVFCWNAGAHSAKRRVGDHATMWAGRGPELPCQTLLWMYRVLETKVTSSKIHLRYHS